MANIKERRREQEKRVANQQKRSRIKEIGRRQELEKRRGEELERFDSQRTAEAERDKLARARALERTKPSKEEQKEEAEWDAKANIGRAKEYTWDKLWNLRGRRLDALRHHK